jgi:hypothetical protein
MPLSEYLLFLQKRFRGLSSTVASNRFRNDFSPKRPKMPFKNCNYRNVIDHWPYSLILGWHGTIYIYSINFFAVTMVKVPHIKN